MMRIDTEDLYQRLCNLANAWHWPGLRQEEEVIPDTVPNMKAGTIIRWWYSGDYDDVALQITENPRWYAGVYAWPYRIFTGWHHFTPYKAKRKQVREAERLAGFLDFSNFASREGRRIFRKRHPECACYSWRRYVREGPPYDFRHETGVSWAAIKEYNVARDKPR